MEEYTEPSTKQLAKFVKIYAPRIEELKPVFEGEDYSDIREHLLKNPAHRSLALKYHEEFAQMSCLYVGDIGMRCQEPRLAGSDYCEHHTSKNRSRTSRLLSAKGRTDTHNE